MAASDIKLADANSTNCDNLLQVFFVFSLIGECLVLGVFIDVYSLSGGWISFIH